MLPTVDVMGISFLNSTMAALVNQLDQRLQNQEQTFLVTANPEILMHARQDKDYEKVLKKANYVIPDGIGIVIGSKLLGRPIRERLTGFDLMLDLLRLAEKRRYRVFMLGAKPGVIDQSVERVKESYPNIEIAGYHHGYFDMDDPEIVQQVKSARPDIVLVGLGFPRQEQWIAKNKVHFHGGLWIGIGGSFDILAGEAKRAPKAWQKLNIEWLYRLIQEPSRWRRMKVLPVFLLKTLRHKK